MDEKKYETMMERWAEREQASAPRLRPTRDMYALLKSRRRTSWYPVMARWATVGVAAAVIVVVAIMHPSMVPLPLFQGNKTNREAFDDKPYPGEAHNETKDMDAAPKQAVTRALSAADKEKQALAKKSDDDAEPDDMPADASRRRDSRQTAPETSLAPSVPASEEVFARSPAPQFADEEQIAEPLAARPAPVAKGFSEAPAEPPVVGEKQPKSRAVTEFGMARSKMAPRREQERFDSGRADELEEKQERPSLANLVLGDQMDAAADCTPLPDASSSSPAGFTAVGRSSGSPAMLTEAAEDAKSEVSTLFQAPASPQICAIKTAEKTLGDKTFHLQEQTWIDTEYVDTQEHLVIQRDSQAYRDLLELLPDIRAYAESGDHILVSLEAVAIEIAPAGRTELTDEDVHLLKSLGPETQ